MIQLGDTTLDLSDPLTLAALIGAVVLILLVLLLVPLPSHLLHRLILLLSRIQVG